MHDFPTIARESLPACSRLSSEEPVRFPSSPSCSPTIQSPLDFLPSPPKRGRGEEEIDRRDYTMTAGHFQAQEREAASRKCISLVGSYGKICSHVDPGVFFSSLGPPPQKTRPRVGAVMARACGPTPRRRSTGTVSRAALLPVFARGRPPRRRRPRQRAAGCQRPHPRLAHPWSVPGGRCRPRFRPSSADRGGYRAALGQRQGRWTCLESRNHPARRPQDAARGYRSALARFPADHWSVQEKPDSLCPHLPLQSPWRPGPGRRRSRLRTEGLAQR